TCASAQQQIAQTVVTAASSRTPDSGPAQPGLAPQTPPPSPPPPPNPGPATLGTAPNPPPPSATDQHKLGPLNFPVNWRFRSEAWDWFAPSVPAQNSYAFEHSLLRIGLGQKTERFEWFSEG